MDKFWEWMIEKKYAYMDTYYGKNNIKLIDNDGTYTSEFEHTNQMLIGYMIEFLFHIGLDEFNLNTVKMIPPSIDRYFDYLKCKIESIELNESL